MRVFTVLLLFAGALVTSAQEATSLSGEFFSGVVITFTAAEVVVMRKGLGKDSSMVRTFSIDEKTKVEGKIKAKAHVTVRYMPGQNETYAVHIIVR